MVVKHFQYKNSVNTIRVKLFFFHEQTHTISCLHLYTNIFFTFIYFPITNSIECITICLILNVIEIR